MIIIIDYLNLFGYIEIILIVCYIYKKGEFCMYCGNCGKEVGAGLKFCTGCGSRLKQTEDIPVSKLKQQDNAVFVAHVADVSEVYLKEFEDAVSRVFVFSLLVLCLPVVNLILIFIASSERNKIRQLPLFQTTLDDPVKIARCESAQRKLTTADTLLKIATILLSVPVILGVISLILTLLTTMFFVTANT